MRVGCLKKWYILNTELNTKNLTKIGKDNCWYGKDLNCK